VFVASKKEKITPNLLEMMMVIIFEIASVFMIFVDEKTFSF